jgi:tetratricopeptide (TPR) repeat protein
VHQNEDADRSIALAEEGSDDLSRRERLLLSAYATWRLGDIAGAEEIFRHLVETASSDREAWFQFGELAYHGWPLRGHSLDAARDVWRQVVALDSSNYPALMHAIRLEARARDTVAVEALLRRAAEVAADGPAWTESRIIAAYGVGTPGEVAAVQGELDSLPAYSLDFLEASIAGLLEEPAAAEGIARRLIEPSQADAVRAEGHIALAHLAFAQGRWREAWAELDRAAKSNPVAAAWSRSYLATLPFFPVPDSVLDQAALELRSAASSAGAAPLYLRLAVDASAAPVIQRYLVEELRMAGAAAGHVEASTPRARGEGEPGALACDPDAGSSATRDLCLDLRAGLAAGWARRTGDYGGALRALESVRMRVPYQYAARSVFFARTRERFLRGESLERAGRLSEAFEWYAAVPNGARLDYVYLAPTHLRRGKILERQGDRAGAAAHYRRVLELWRQPDPELAALRRDAEDGLRRVSAGS